MIYYSAYKTLSEVATHGTNHILRQGAEFAVGSAQGPVEYAPGFEVAVKGIGAGGSHWVAPKGH